MSYKKAADVLPAEILQLLQEYVSGEYIYVPQKESTRKTWGETTGIREDIRQRNSSIYREYLEGRKIYELAERHYLSYKSIQRILTQERRKHA